MFRRISTLLKSLSDDFAQVVKGGFVVLFGLAMMACVVEDDVEERVKVGDALPVFRVRLNDGCFYDSSIRDGRGSVIVFFETSCTDCQRELPLLNMQYLMGRFGDSHVVCISRGEPAERIEAYWREQNLSMPYSAQPDRMIYELFATIGVPRVYIVDANGKITTIQRP